METFDLNVETTRARRFIEKVEPENTLHSNSPPALHPHPLTFEELSSRIPSFSDGAVLHPVQNLDEIVEELQHGSAPDPILTKVKLLNDESSALDLREDGQPEWNRSDRPNPVKTRNPWLESSKCDKVQFPPPGAFNSDALDWFGSRCDAAWIPASRLEDFILGENMRDNFRTQFVIAKSMAHRINRTGPLEKIVCWYSCCFGPQDKRHWKTKTVPYELKSKEHGDFLKKKALTGNSIKRGCKCSFTATKFTDRPDTVLIRWLHRHKGQILSWLAGPNILRF